MTTEFEDRDWELDDHDWSEKAWMSVTDADLFEALLRRKAAEGRPLEILEWGSGRSTLYYTGVLANAGARFRWLSLEYDRGFFNTELRPALDRLPNPRVIEVDAVGGEDRDAAAGPGARDVAGANPASASTVELVLFDKGRLQPALRAHREDRHADLDAYVAYPGRLGRRFDVVLVDGRKRRRCLVEASRLLTKEGIAVLHDAWRPYYHCAFDVYRNERRIGDILWTGTQAEPPYLENLLTEIGA